MNGYPPVNLAIAIETNKGKRNTCLFFGIIALAVTLLLGWTKWLLLIPAVLGIGSFLYHMNILIVSSELRRRNNEPEQTEESEATELPSRLTNDEIEERKRKLAYMTSHKEMIAERAAEYMVEQPDESPDDVVDIVAEKCFLEHEIARLKNEIRGHDSNPIDAIEIVSQVGEIFAHLSDQRLLVKPRSTLPRSWFAVRECFMIAYEAQYLQLPENLKEPYHHVYRELAFFVDDGLCSEFNASLSVAAECRSQRLREIGHTEDEAISRMFIVSDAVKVRDRKAIWEHLASETTCPRRDLLLLAETLSYCAELHSAMWNEWAAFANLIEYRQKTAKEG